MEIIAGVAALACAVRFSILLWHGCRYRKVKSAAPWSAYYDRHANRIFYWMLMGAHTLVVAACLWAVVYIGLDLLRAAR